MRHVVLMAGVLLATACASSPGREDDDDAADAVAVGKGDGVRIAEGTPQAAGILRVANELSREALAEEVELGARATDGIVAGRPFATLAALDAVPYVGPVTFDKLLAAAEARGWVGPPACMVVSGDAFALDIPTVRLSGQITVGRKVPPRGWDGGTISLQTAAGDRVSLGETGDGVYTVATLPGTYEIVYEHGAGEAVPQNRRARLGSVTLTASRRLDIDVPVVAVTPAVTLDGAAPPPTSAELRLRRGDDEVSLGQIWDAARPVLVVPGTYDVEYVLDDARDEAAAIPRNRETTVRRGAELARDQRLGVELATAPVAARVAEGRALLAGVLIDATPTTMLRGEYDVEQWLSSFIHAVVGRVRVDGPTTVEVTARSKLLTTRVTVNGGEAPLGDGGVILLRRGAETIWLGRSTSRSFATQIIAGQGPYDVVWSYQPSDFRAIEVPQNQEAVLARGVDVDALDELVVDLRAVSVSGRVSGAQAGDAVLLVGVDHPANRLAIRPAADGSFTTLALPGRYRAAFRSWLPNVTAAPYGDVITVAAPATSLALTVPARAVRSTVTFDGAAEPAGGGWTLSFVSPGETILSSGGEPHGDKPLVPGRYDLVYAATSTTAAVPANQRALVGCLDVRAPE